jgi:serine/threonine-protein kinase
MTGAADAVPTQLVAGKYQLTRMLGRGGMGSVWEGIHTSLGTRVAVKFIETEYADSREARSRFENEARAAATLRSKHVVQVFDHGVLDDGRPYIVMEFLAGEPLDRRLDRVGRLPPAETAKIVSQICRALAKAHEAGIVHRDLKPENVFLVWDEEDGSDIVKVVDFGIAKFNNSSIGISSATRTGSVLGTPYYMSPEQARGLRSVDYRSDLWSVGVIVYRCMIGVLPFDGEAIGDLLVKLCTAPLPVPSQSGVPVPPGFDEWFARALQREPSARFATALELSESLSAVCGVPTRARLNSSTAAEGAGATRPTGGAITPPTMRMDSTAASTPAPMTQTATPAKPFPAGAVAAIVAAAILLVVVIGSLVLLKSRGEEPTPGANATAAPPPAPQPAAPAAAQLAPVISAAPEAAAAAPAGVVAEAPKKAAASKPTSRATAPKPAKPPPTKPALPEAKPSIDVGY